MRRFLIVGCGGSGAATLAYMMDQLRSDLAAAGVDRIPSGWQFIVLDVPTSPEPLPGLADVREQGGTYVGTGPQGGDSYRVLDNSLSQQLANRQRLDTIATWAPRDPGTVHNPLSTGAGQYRALGRMITLSRIGLVRQQLQRAWDTLFTQATDSEMRRLSIPGAGSYDPNDRPIVLVVSSMAGGAGASMALDICRVLTLVQGVDPRLMGMFMVAPDIFASLPSSHTTGTKANALAMLGEIVASQTGSAREHDVALLRALGHEHGEGEMIPFARVFPVGRTVGQGAVFGDGTPSAVYRGLGRGLSALILSATATHQFVGYDLTNEAGVAGSREFLGWGNGQWNNIPWSTFGFSSLSMGRDRYAEYAAQRLARSCVDKLLYGHLQSGNTASGEEQVNAILDNQWSYITRALGLPDRAVSARDSVGPWIGGTVLPDDVVTPLARQITQSVLRRYLHDEVGISATQWVALVRRVLGERRHDLIEAARQAADHHAFHWQRRFVGNLETATAGALAQQGQPYATGLVKRTARVMQDVVLPTCQDLARSTPDITRLPTDTEAVLGSLKGSLASTAEFTDRILDGVAANVRQQIYVSLAGRLADAVGALSDEVFAPLITALDESQRVLRQAADSPARDVGLAHLKTDEYAAWPADQDHNVASRFSEANNEVMLTSSAVFKQRYEIDLPHSVDTATADRRDFGDGVARASFHVITGRWDTVSGIRAPGDDQPVVERTTTWRSKAFPVNPDTGNGLIAQRARYDVHTRPSEILSRARQFVERPGTSFERFISVSLREHVIGADGAPESELSHRRRDFVVKFVEAVSLARPLASVNENALQAVHGDTQMAYRFKFSDIPFKKEAVHEEMIAALREQPRIEATSVDAFSRALTDESRTKRIDVFGSYPNYSPLVYNSVVEPAAQQWLAATPSSRSTFWRMRRARPLHAALPMHVNERRACVGGWVLGRAIGYIGVPTALDQPVRVYDTEIRNWRDFPNPLLTPPSEFLAEYDWLPAVLESVLIAIAASHQPPVMTSMRPYRALRRIFDEGREDPTTGMHVLAARAHMTAWLRSGDLRSGVPSIIDGTEPGVSVDQRAEQLRGYLREFHDFAGHHYMGAGEGGGAAEPGARGGGAFSVIGVREQASNAPIFRDIAADVFWATRLLLGIVDDSAEDAKRPEKPAVHLPHASGGAPDGYSAPRLGTSFEIPKGGNF